MDPTAAKALRELVRASGWMTWVLRSVRRSELPDAWVGAGAVRDLVWGELYGDGFDPAAVRDVDVAFFDPSDLGRQRDMAATEMLSRIRPDVEWEATNQAAVHTWYHLVFGGAPVEPLRSIVDAVETWPETATAVALRLDVTGEVEICAPLGLADLMGGVWRRNPCRVTVERSRERLARHRPAQRWVGVRVIPPE
jgi:hypothetical protein